MMLRLSAHGCAAALVMGPLLFPPSAVTSHGSGEWPELTAEAWLLYDATAGITLGELASDVERPMASVTKIMTALVVREHADLDEKVRISDTAAGVGESEIGLVVGEVWLVDDLLAAVVMRSANDAATALAEHVGGSVTGFADMMNAKAVALELGHSHFTNPHGLDEDDHYTSARDLLVMTLAVLEDPYLARLARTRLISFKPDPSGVARRARNTNELLGAFPGVIGMKTGFTSGAGRVLVAVAGHGGRTLVAIVMGSEDHFADTRDLLGYGFGLLSLDMRFQAPTVLVQGGGGAPGTATLDERTRAALLAVPKLSDGTVALTGLAGTELVIAVEAWVRELVPITLGGDT